MKGQNKYLGIRHLRKASNTDTNIIKKKKMPEKTIKKRTLKTKILREMLLYPGKKHKDTIFEKKKKKKERERERAHRNLC